MSINKINKFFKIEKRFFFYKNLFYTFAHLKRRINNVKK